MCKDISSGFSSCISLAFRTPKPSLQGAVLPETHEGAQMPWPSGHLSLAVHGGCHQVAVREVGCDGPGISPLKWSATVVEGGEGWAKYGKMMKNGQTYVKFMNSWNWISKLDLLAAWWGKNPDFSVGWFKWSTKKRRNMRFSLCGS